MTKTINLELTLEELKLIDKYVDGEPETVELFKKIRAAYPKIYTLWDVMRDELGFSVDMCDEIVDAVEKWLPKEHDTNSYKWNECIRTLRKKLR